MSIRIKAGWLRHATIERLVTVTTDRRLLALSSSEKFEILAFQIPGERHDPRRLLGASTRAPYFMTPEGRKHIFRLADGNDVGSRGKTC